MVQNQKTSPWHNLEVDKVLALLGSVPRGLSRDEAGSAWPGWAIVLEQSQNLSLIMSFPVRNLPLSRASIREQKQT